MTMKGYSRPHLRPSDYDNSGDILPMGYKRLKDGTIIDTEEELNEKERKNDTIYSFDR